MNKLASNVPGSATVPRWAEWSVAGFLIVLYLVTTPGKWWPTPDSAVYLGLANSLAQGKGYRFNGEISARAAPGMSLLLAGWSKLFGTSWFSLHLFMSVSALATLWLVHRCLKRLTDRRLSLLVVLVMGMSFPFFQNAHRILTDVPFAAMFWSVLYCLIRLRSGSYGWLVLAAALTAVALCVRLPGLVILGPLVLGLLADRWEGARAKRYWSAGVIAAASILTAGVFYLLSRTVGDSEPVYLTLHVTKVGRNVLTAPFPWLLLSVQQFLTVLGELLTSQDGRVLAWVLCGPLVVAMGVGLAIEWKNGTRWFLVTLVVSVVGFAMLGGPNFVTARYLFLLYPLMLLAIFSGLCRILQKISSLRARALPPGTCWRAVCVLAVIALAANIPRVGRNAYYFAYLSHTDAYYDRLRHGEFVDLFPLAQRLRSECASDEVVASAMMANALSCLSDCRIVKIREDVATDSLEAMRESLSADAPIGFVVLPTRDAKAKHLSSESAENLSSTLEQEGVKVLFRGKRMILYRLPRHDKPQAPSAPVSNS